MKCFSLRVSCFLGGVLMAIILSSLSSSVALADTIDPLPVDTPVRGITLGPNDDGVWIAGASALWRNDISGGPFDRFDYPTPNAGPGYITVGPDSALWFTEPQANQIGRKPPTGPITEIPLGGQLGLSHPLGITSCRGAVWFTAQGLFGLSGRIGRIDMNGEVSSFAIPPLAGLFSQPNEITCDNSGALWFTDPATNRVGQMTTDGEFTMFEVPTPDAGVNGIACAPDSTCWFTEGEAHQLAQITSAGRITEHKGPAGDIPVDLAIAPFSSSVYEVLVTADGTRTGKTEAELEVYRVDSNTLTFKRVEDMVPNDPNSSHAKGITALVRTYSATGHVQQDSAQTGAIAYADFADGVVGRVTFTDVG